MHAGFRSKELDSTLVQCQSRRQPPAKSPAAGGRETGKIRYV